MNSRTIHVMLLTLLISWSPGSYSDTVQNVPPITVKVVDEDSGEALPGIKVHHIIIRDTHWTLFPLTIEPHIDSTIAAPATVQTDSDGIATIDNIRVELKSFWLSPKRQLIDSEMLFINLDPLPEWPAAKSHYEDSYRYLRSEVPFFKNLTRPNRDYLGYFLGLAEISSAHGEEEGAVTVRWEPYTFPGVAERSFVVRVKRYTPDDTQPVVPAHTISP